jgi:quercetin dioxygenase-like cupin family protein
MGKESHYSSKKDRVFVRGIQGQYSLKDELKRLRSMPRVIKGRDLMFNDGPQSFSKHFVEPVDGLTQTLHVHLEEYAPGDARRSTAITSTRPPLYILDGTGYEVHDGVRYDWKAGDIAIVHMNCVHQHFNADPDKPARALADEARRCSLHEHAVPADGDPAAEGRPRDARGRRLRPAPLRNEPQPRGLAMAWDESKAWKRGRHNQKLYQGKLEEAAGAAARNAKRRKILHPEDMPWELSPQGLLKHLLNEGMNTRMETVDAYMLIIAPGSRSGKHRQLAEECLYVLEGRGYDLHQDCDVEIIDTILEASAR